MSHKAIADRIAPAVLDALHRAAHETGVTLLLLLTFVSIETGGTFDPDAKAPKSTALGLFQFLRQTWLGMLHRCGAAYGYVTEAALIAWSRPHNAWIVTNPGQEARILDLRRDPLAAALMGAEFLTANAAALVKAFRGNGTRSASWEPDATDLYCAHLFGEGDAVKFLSICAATPSRIAAEHPDFKAAAAANRGTFYDQAGNARTFLAVWQFLDQHVKAHEDQVRLLAA